MNYKRSSGILLHVSSLPGKYGIGDAGQVAYQWIDFLEETGTRYWQILPLNPTGFGNSPYQGLSAFAGNSLFIDLDSLVNFGLMDEEFLTLKPKFPISRVDFDKVIKWKRKYLEHAFENFLRLRNTDLAIRFRDFKEKNKDWLLDFSTFMSIREEFNLVSWSKWPKPLKMREKEALNVFINKNKNRIEMHSFFQFIFYFQWKSLKEYANQKGVQIIGDIPIFMGFDSADVWANPHLFELDKSRNPIIVAGVPPDFFSKTGQLWGNPLYDWDVHIKDEFKWWVNRVRGTLKTVDLIRLDHFRGFAGYYQIPAGDKTAENGKWMKGPGRLLFDSMKSAIGNLPFIAEDLGVITPDVINLRDRYQFPGMRLFQFAFWENADDEFLPHNYPENCVAYTGTHDNDTSKSWFRLAPEYEISFCRSYLGYHTKNIAHEMILKIWSSVAVIAIAPMQDFLQLGTEARMNLPATTAGNWLWRMKPKAITERLVEWIKEINITFGRAPQTDEWSAKKYFHKKIK